jgi:hypothetical protein
MAGAGRACKKRSPLFECNFNVVSSAIWQEMRAVRMASYIVISV